VNVNARLAAVAAIGLLASACSGHSGSMTPDVRTMHVSFVLDVPRAPASGPRTPAYISAGTKSVSVNQQNFNATPSTGGCATVASGLQCTFTISAPIGTAVPFVVTTFDQTLTAGGQTQGNQLSTGTTYANVVESAANVVQVTLLGTPAHVNLNIADPSPPIGVAATIPMTVDARDAAGFAIVGTYSSAIQISLNSSGSLAFLVNGVSTPSPLLTASSDTIQLVYPGHFVRDATITANLQFAAAGTIIGSTPFTPQIAFGDEVAVHTSLLGASAWRDQSFLHQTWFTEPAKSMYATYPLGQPIVEITTPSGNAPLRINGGPMAVRFTETNSTIGANLMYPDFPTLTFDHVLSATDLGIYQIGGVDQNIDTFFTEKTAGKIGRFATNNQFTEFPTGRAGSTPAGMAYADGSSFWFADPGADAIGRVTVAGGVTWYETPTSGAHPTEITPSDGNQHWWFTEPGISKIASLDNNGVMHEYASGGVPVQIVADYTDIFVLTASHTIEDYNPQTGTYVTLTPPPSANGPAVGIGDGGADLILVLRSDGTNGSIQELNFE
jgi:hypothetical protein